MLFANTYFIVSLSLFMVLITILVFSSHQIKALYHLQKHKVETQGIITDVWIEESASEDTEALIGYQYVFSGKGSNEYTGVSYGKLIIPIGQKMTVLYDPHLPQYSRGVSMTFGKSEPTQLVIIICLLPIFLSLLIHSAAQTYHRVLYLERGELAWAKRKSRNKYQAQEYEEESPQYTILYCFTSPSGKEHYVSDISLKAKDLRKKTLIVYPSSFPHEAKFVTFWNTPLSPWKTSISLWAESAITPTASFQKPEKSLQVKRTLPSGQKLLVFFDSKNLLILGIIAALTIFRPLTLHDWKTHLALKNDFQIANGEVIKAQTIKEETEEDWPLYKYNYIFYSPQLGQYSGTGYTKEWLEIGHKLKVHYAINNPYYNRATDLSTNRYSINLGLFWLIGLIVFVISAIVSFRKSLRAIRVIQTGSLVMAKRTKKKLIDSSEGVRTYRYTYEFNTSSDESFSHKIKTSRAKRMKREVPVAYSSQKPEEPIYICLLPKKVNEFVLSEWFVRH